MGSGFAATALSFLEFAVCLVLVLVLVLVSVLVPAFAAFAFPVFAVFVFPAALRSAPDAAIATLAGTRVVANPNTIPTRSHAARRAPIPGTRWGLTVGS